MISLLVTLFLFAVAAASWATMSHYAHHAEVEDPTSFWGKNSWTRKYKQDHLGRFTIAPNTLYYRIFKIDYVERFPLSATLLVFVTDYWHFFQWVMITCICIAFSSSIAGFILLWSLWHIAFTVTHKVLKK